MCALISGSPSDIDDGLIAGHSNCSGKSLDDISTESRALIDRAMEQTLTSAEYTDATFSISNLGMFDVENFIAVLIPLRQRQSLWAPSATRLSSKTARSRRAGS